MHPDWPESIRDQCLAADVPFHFKQNGEWTSEKPDVVRELAVVASDETFHLNTTAWNGRTGEDSESGDVYVYRIGKKAAGRLLDGREWNEFPVGSLQMHPK
jgi:protein gp37